MGIAAFVLACLLALFAPVVVHALVLGSWDDLRHFLDFGDILGAELALVYLTALVFIGVAGALFASGRRVPPVVLHIAALMPLVWGICGYVVRDRMRVAKLDQFGFGRDNVDDFAYAIIRAEAALDFAATMSAFTLMLVALAAVLRHASRHDGARTLLVASVSSALCAATAIHAYSRRALFYAIVVRDNREERFTHAAHGLFVADTTRAVAIALVVMVIACGVVMARRIRAPAGKSAFALLVVLAFSFGVPRAIAARDDALFNHTPNPSAAPEGVHPPSSMFPWRSAPTNHDPRLVVTRDGTPLFDARDGKLAPMTDADFDHDPLGCIVDRDATFGAFRRSVPETKRVWLTFYVAPGHPPDVSSEGALAAFIVGTNTTAEVAFADTDPFEKPEYVVFITLDELTLRIWHKSGPELVAPATNEAAAIAARRAALATVSELGQSVIYIHGRDGDTLGRIWSIADDIYAVLRGNVGITLTARERFDYEAYQRKRRSEFSF